VTDWSSLQTADGSAESVPTWIAQLSAASLPERDEAFLRLVGQLVGEGVTHDAAPPAFDALSAMRRASAHRGPAPRPLDPLRARELSFSARRSGDPAGAGPVGRHLGSRRLFPKGLPRPSDYQDRGTSG
jgi:hypothetical protein